ncbi:MAG: efflux RND transporter permease subunit [bacterium]
MGISKLSVKRPITTTMVFLFFVLFGVISWLELPQELFTSLSFPQLTIVTQYPNAAPEEIENLITKIIETSIGTVKDLKRVSSVSKEGASLVTAEFGWNTNMDFASLWVREKLDQIKEQLPPECKEPVVIKYNPLSKPVIILNITGRMTTNELLQVSKKVIKDRLEKTEGVAAIEISGGDEKEVLVEIDQGKLLANQLSLSEVVESIKNTNINYPAGTTSEKLFDYLIRTMGEYTSIKEIGDTVVETTDYKSQKFKYRKLREDEENIDRKEQKGKRLLRLSSIADIKWSFKEKTSYSRYNGIDNISIQVRKRAEANTINTAKNIKKNNRRT